MDVTLSADLAKKIGLGRETVPVGYYEPWENNLGISGRYPGKGSVTSFHCKNPSEIAKEINILVAEAIADANDLRKEEGESTIRYITRIRKKLGLSLLEAKQFDAQILFYSEPFRRIKGRKAFEGKAIIESTNVFSVELWPLEAAQYLSAPVGDDVILPSGDRWELVVNDIGIITLQLAGAKEYTLTAAFSVSGPSTLARIATGEILWSGELDNCRAAWQLYKTGYRSGKKSVASKLLSLSESLEE